MPGEAALEGAPTLLLILGSILCVVGGGLAAGLTIGLMSLDNGMYSPLCIMETHWS